MRRIPRRKLVIFIMQINPKRQSSRPPPRDPLIQDVPILPWFLRIAGIIVNYIVHIIIYAYRDIKGFVLNAFVTAIDILPLA